MKKISILMSVYNETENELKEAIDSILNQTYPDFELIIVNDNPLNSELCRIMERYRDVPKIRYLVNESNQGLATSLNNALEVATGDYIARMDADDISDRIRLEREVRFLEENGLDMVHANCRYIDENGIVSGEKPKLPEREKDIEKLLQWSSFICHPSVLMKRSALESVGGYRSFRTAQDYDLWLRMLSAGYKLGTMNEYLIYYRSREGSISRQNMILRPLLVQYMKKLHRQRICTGKDEFDEAECRRLSETAKKLSEDTRAIKAMESVSDAIKRRDTGSFLINSVRLGGINKDLLFWSLDLAKYGLYRKLYNV